MLGLPDKTREKTEKHNRKKREKTTGKTNREKNMEKKTGKKNTGKNNGKKHGKQTYQKLMQGRFINISRDWAYLIAGGSLIAPGHYTRKNYYNIFLGCFF
jgi:hypothetical protein